MSFLYALPSAVLLVLVTALMVAVAVGGHLVVRRLFGAIDFTENNTVVGIVMNIVGVVYAVVLGFLVVITWQGHVTTDRILVDEVNAIADLYRFAPTLGEPLAGRIRSDLRRYVDLEIGEEWPALQRGERGVLAGRQTEELVDHLFLALRDDRVPSAALSRALSIVERMLDARRSVLFANERVIPPVLWLTLLLGSVLTLSMTFLVGTKNVPVHLLLTAGAAAFLGIMLVVIIELDAPFRGDTGITTQYWRELQASFRDPHL